MAEHFSEDRYSQMLDALFQRFPSFQKVGSGAYKPGIGNMEFIDQLLGHPHRNYKVIHVAGTNGKGSVSNMLTSSLAALGFKVGLYTSPHILDFRERMRVVEPVGAVGEVAFRLIAKEEVWDFVNAYKDTFDHLDMSFFEITTIMALDWFARQEVDYVVLETGLGGRLDSTNIVKPVLSVITNIGLDHCDLLGDTLPEIAFEKAGIIKPCVPVVVGESHPETDAVFERKVLYTNLPEPMFMGSRKMIEALLTFADRTEPMLWDRHEAILAEMDLQGAYQHKNLRTALTALSVLASAEPQVAAAVHGAGVSGQVSGAVSRAGADVICEAIVSTASRTGFRGRWDKISDNPVVICDIGHNAHGLKYNFAQLAKMKAEGRCSELIIVYGSVADKDLDSVLPLMPVDARYIFTQAHGKRALSADVIAEKFSAAYPSVETYKASDVKEAVQMALDMAAVSGSGVASVAGAGASASSSVCASAASDSSVAADNADAGPLIYIGGSTYVVSEAVEFLSGK